MSSNESSKYNSGAEASIPIGTTVDRYNVIDHIGTGGMAEVYLAEDTELHRKVALKFQSITQADDPDQRKRFIREARSAASLNHSNIITIYEVGEYNSRPFIAMEYIQGHTLEELAEEGNLSIDDIVEIAIQICEGLECAHGAGMIHRDIKPANILIDDESRVRILDFGLARIEGGTSLSGSDCLTGTIAYMSPEQIRGEPIDSRSDIFSAGSTIYYLITGQQPFQGNYEAAISYAIAYQEPVSLENYRHDVPSDLVKIVQRALLKNPDQRYQTASDISNDLKSIVISKRKHEQVATAPDVDRPPSIAIFPFVDLSPQKDQQYFCDGMADELINTLTEIKGLRVVSRISSLQVPAGDVDIREVGQNLGVDTVLEGSVRKANDKFRIMVQLVNVNDGFYMWSEKYDRSISDIFAVQEEISRAVAEKLKVRLQENLSVPLVQPATENLEAYKLYLKGRYFWNRRYEGGLQKSIEYFQRAIEQDPLYALAYAGLADSFNIVAFYNFASPQDTCLRAKAAALKALELNSNLSEAHTALGWVYTFFDWNWKAAEDEFKRALELNETYATAHHYYALLLLAVERFEEGIDRMKRALELDPLSMIINTSLGAAYYFSRDYDDSIEHYLKTFELDANFALAHAYLSGPYVEKSMISEAIIECQKAGALSAGSNYVEAFLGYIYGVSGEKGKAESILSLFLEQAEKKYVSSHHLALIYTGLGDKDNAFKWLGKACDERDNWMVWLNVHPVFDSLRSDKRFDKLLKRVGLKSKRKN
jgi:serine/threonine-protein kinase